MRILVIGGSWFVGRTLVNDAVQRRHEVTVFNRGGTVVDVPGVTLVRGDRTDPQALARLAESGPWDAVVDVPGLVPAHVRDAAQALRHSVRQYVFISSVSAYQDWPSLAVTEVSPCWDGDPDFDPGEWTWDEGLYGSMKVGSERALAREFEPERLLVLRPSIILGPHEYSARLTWWLSRANHGGRILAPAPATRGLQPIDVRDMASFVLDQIESRAHGTFNLAAPPGHASFDTLVRACVTVCGREGEFTWADPEWLASEGVAEWTELPLWRTAPGTWAVNTDHARAAGLVCRQLEETVADTWAWMTAGGMPVPHDRQARHGIDPGKETGLLARWDAR